ncbi:MAG TPA: T9SS type A sorting domain-containing protein [Parafilimonas sp.]|nr:T9SS type A sorting domain-containing protein [Parafilimonas sp.]
MKRFALINVKAAFSLLLLFLILASHITAQSTGDFRSKKNGLWTDISVWQTYNGSSWLAANKYPNYNDKTITIQNTVTIQAIALDVDQVVINAGSSLNVTQSAILRLKNGNGSDLQNNGTLKVVGSTVRFDNGANLLNDLQGTFTFQQTNIVAGAGTLTNKNVLSTSTSLLLPDSITCNQVSGIITGGTLNIAGTLNVSSGDIKVPVTLLNTAVFNINTVSPKHLSSITNNGTINWNVGAINFYPGSLFTNNSQLNVYGQRTLPDTLTFEQVSGSIMGSGSLRITDTMNVSGGDIKVPLTILNGAVMNINSTSAKNLSSLTNLGIMNWNTSNIGLHAGAIFTNSGKLNIYNQGTLVNADNIATSLNNTAKGKIDKFPAKYDNTTIAADMNNDGSIIVHGGTLDIKAAFHNRNIFKLEKLSSFLIEGSYYAEASEVFGDSGYISNLGTVFINYSDTLPQAMRFDNYGALNGTGQLFVPGSMYLYGSSAIPVTITNTGTCESLAANLAAPFTNNGVTYLSTGLTKTSADIINNGLALLDNDFCTFQPLGPAARFVNNGELKGSYGYPSTLIMYFPFVNSASGTLSGIGALRFEDTLINRGSINPGLKNPGQLPFFFGPFRNTSTTNIRIGKNANNQTKADNVFVYYNGETNVAGTLNLYQATSVVDTGYYTIVDTYGMLGDTDIVGSFSVINKPSNWDVIYANNSVKVHIKAPEPFAQAFASNQLTSGIRNDSKFDAPCLIFPNPARFTVTVQFNSVKAGSFLIELYDPSGKRLLFKTGSVNAGANRIELDVNGCPAGVCFINLIDAEGTRKSLSFVKQ